MNTGIIYKATSRTTKKSYIGQTIRTLQKRKNSHFSTAFNPKSEAYNLHFHLAIRKYGKQDFIWTILYHNIPIHKLDKLEISTIAKYNTYKKGYNSTVGGKTTRGLKHSKQTRKKMSASRTGLRCSEETKKKISKANKGRKHTAQSIKNMSAGQKKKNINTGAQK